MTQRAQPLQSRALMQNENNYNVAQIVWQTFHQLQFQSGIHDKQSGSCTHEKLFSDESSRNVTIAGYSRKHKRSFDIKQFYAAFNEKENTKIKFSFCVSIEKKWNMNEPIVCEQIWSKNDGNKKKNFPKRNEKFFFLYDFKDAFISRETRLWRFLCRNYVRVSCR